MIKPVEGLPLPEVIVVKGCEPVILLHDWASGPWREIEIAYLLAECWVQAFGWQEAEATQSAVLVELGAQVEFAAD